MCCPSYELIQCFCVVTNRLISPLVTFSVVKPVSMRKIPRGLPRGSSLSKKPRRVRGPQAANKVQYIFRGGVPQGDFRWACTSRKILCAGLGPEELASADPTVDVGPECVFAHFMRENARVGAKSLLSKKGTALFGQAHPARLAARENTMAGQRCCSRFRRRMSCPIKGSSSNSPSSRDMIWAEYRLPIWSGSRLVLMMVLFPARRRLLSSWYRAL